MADYFTSLRFNNIMCIYIMTTIFVSLEYLESTFLVLGNYLIIYDTCILYNTQCSFVRNCVHIYIHFWSHLCILAHWRSVILVLFSLYNIIRIRAFDKLVLLSGKKVRGNIIPESIRFFIKKKKNPLVVNVIHGLNIHDS